MKNTIGMTLLAGSLLPVAYLLKAVFPSPIPSAMAFGMGIFGWLMPEGALLLLAAIGPLGRSPVSQVLSFSMLGNTKVIMACMFCLVWTVRVYLGKPRRPLPAWFKFIAAAWACLAVVGVLHTEDAVASLPHLAACLAGLGLFFAAWNSDNKVYKKLACVGLFVGFGVTLLSLLQYLALRFHILSSLWPFILAPRERLFMQLDWSPMGEHFFRVSGSFPHPNALGVYYYLIIPFVAASLTLGPFRKWHRVLLASAFLLMLAGLYATNCRAAFIAVAISFAFLSCHRGCRWLLAAGAATVAVLALLYICNPQGIENYFQSVSRTEHGISSRGSIWTNACDLFSRHFFLGVGPGQFVNHYNSDFGLFVFDNPHEIFEQTLLLQTERYDLIDGYHAHNTPLQLICEYGVVALPLFVIGIMAVIFAAERRALRLPVGTFGRAMALGTASFFSGYLVSSFFDSYTTFTSMGLICLAAPLVAAGLRSV